ncbi:hypothetical protein JHK85_006300 [Glycine max]|nr:hypothetical protein JHK85_006300 [Glycine max]
MFPLALPHPLPSFLCFELPQEIGITSHQYDKELTESINVKVSQEIFYSIVHEVVEEIGVPASSLSWDEVEKYLIVHNGNWDEVEKYLSGFTKVDDNRYSMKIFFEIRKQKYLEALDKHDWSKAVEILVKDLKVFVTFNEELFNEITQLLTLENFRKLPTVLQMRAAVCEVVNCFPTAVVNSKVLKENTRRIKDSMIEDNRFCVTVHYRCVKNEEEVGVLKEMVKTIMKAYPDFTYQEEESLWRYVQLETGTKVSSLEIAQLAVLCKDKLIPCIVYIQQSCNRKFSNVFLALTTSAILHIRLQALL